MAAVLITGMSGTGKSSVLGALHARGWATADLDDGWCVPQPDGTQLWDVPAITRLLDAAGDSPLFVAGCEENMGVLLPRFSRVILLTAPWPTLEGRLIAREDNPFGSTPEERARVRQDQEEVEPRLRAIAHTTIDTCVPLEDVVDLVLRASGMPGH